MIDQILFDKVIEVLNKYDFEGLIKCGCPKDEYSPEAKYIINLLDKNKTYKELSDEIKLFWGQMFNPESDHNFDLLAKDLLILL